MTAETGGSSTERGVGTALPRRRFLGIAGAALVIGGLSACRPTVPILPVIPAGSTSSPPAPGPLQRSGWTALVGRIATLDGPAGVARAEIVAVTAGPGVDEERCFSVLLRATDDVVASSALHRVTVAGLESTDLFVSPVDRGAQQRWYQIIVNNPS